MADVDEHARRPAAGGRARARRTRASTGRTGCTAGGRRRRRSRRSAASCGAGTAARRRRACAGAARAGRSSAGRCRSARRRSRRRRSASAGRSARTRGRSCRRRCRGSRSTPAVAASVGERQHEHLVPVVAGQVRAGAQDRVHGLALVELQRARAVGVLHDARVLVLGVGLVDDARAGVGLALDRADRQREQRRDGDRRQRRSARARGRPPRARRAASP